MFTKKTQIKRLAGNDAKLIHGHYCDEKWISPRLVAESEEACRSDQGNTITANEYLDEPEVLQAKIKKIAELIRKSKFTVAYTGAGLSKASGIPDYATKSKNTVVEAPKITSSLDALPTYAHCVLTAMERKGLIHNYVQQNHDGLPQKSGFPQEKMNEIHGAWFDPSNRVVQFSESLRGDLFSWMTKVEKKTDLCLCLGTSLSGMNADRMANTPAEKMLKGKALGTIIINLQRTPLDDMSAIRVWAKLDDAFKLLIKELEISEDTIRSLPRYGTELPKKFGDVFTLPYDKNGVLSTTQRCTLDLREGAKVRIANPGASNKNALGTIVGKRNGDWSVELEEKPGKLVRRLLGKWWIEAALRGAIDQLPVVNQTPKVTDVNEDVMIDDSDEEVIELPSKIQIVQSHKVIGTDKHEWGLRVADACLPFVSKVEYTLHHTFRDPIRMVTEAPFSLACTGWGTFDVKVRVFLKNGAELKTKHSLTFENEGNDVSFTEVKL